jgi:hypothetical protein
MHKKQLFLSIAYTYYNKKNCPLKAFDYENSSNLTITYWTIQSLSFRKKLQATIFMRSARTPVFTYVNMSKHESPSQGTTWNDVDREWR